MKAETMRAKSPDELKEMVMDLRKEQMTLRFQKSGAQLENTSRLRTTRRDIARAKTLINEQKRGDAKAAAPKTKTRAAPAKKPAKAKA